MEKCFLLKFYLFALLLCGNCFATVSLENAPPTFIVTCASGELGTAVAKLLARNHNLILTGRDISKLLKLQNELKAHNPWQYEICTLDYSSHSSIADFKKKLEETS